MPHPELVRRSNGTVSAVIDASGDLQNYQRGTAKAEVSKLDLKWNGESIRTEGLLVASYASGTATIDKATILAADSAVEVSGSLPIEAGASEGTVQLKTQLNLQGIARLVPSLANIDYRALRQSMAPLRELSNAWTRT